MTYYVYMLKTLSGFKKKTYIGYTINLKNRLNKHNISKGAKATKGYKWKIIYKKRFNSRSKAMSYEYFLKKDRKKRLSILESIIDE
jgi:putative endonuclease